MDTQKLIAGIKTGLDVAQSVGVPYTAYASILVNLVNAVASHTGKTDEEVMAQVGPGLDDNEKHILANLQRLKDVQPQPAPAPVPPAQPPAPHPAPTPTPQPSQPAPSDQRSIPELQAAVARKQEKLKTETDPARVAELTRRIAENEAEIKSRQ